MTTTTAPIIAKTLYKGRVAQLYGRIAPFYDMFTDYERAHHKKAIALANIQPHHIILDVPCGTGRATLPIARLLDESGKLYGIDLTPQMLERARKKLVRHHLDHRAELRIGDVRKLPFEDDMFDLVYNGYMFDLFDIEAFLPILIELKRVLKPGGKLVLVNMSKNTHRTTLYERLYKWGVLGATSGACRPVLMDTFVEKVGFINITRTYHNNRSLIPLNYLIGTEIVICTKPD